VDPKSDIKHITAKCVLNGVISADNAAHLSLVTHLKNPKSALEVGDVVTTAGIIGRCGIVTNSILPANIDKGVARIKILRKKLSPYCLIAFLMNEYGRAQMKLNVTGQDRQHFPLKKLSRLLIPRLSSLEAVETKLQDSIQKSFEARQLYFKAEQTILDAMGLSKYESRYLTHCSGKLSDAFSAHRADAEYFQPAYETLLESISRESTIKDSVTLRIV
jgi:hypothetical protein